MKRWWIFVLVVVAIGCDGAEKAGPRPEPESREPASDLLLKPDVSRSFATICETTTTIGILGEDWALRMVLPSPGATLEPGDYAVAASLVRGPELENHVRPAAGPRTPPLPSDERYSVSPVTGLTVVVSGQARAYEGPVVLTLSSFEAGGVRFRSLGPIQLAVKGPYP